MRHAQFVCLSLLPRHPVQHSDSPSAHLVGFQPDMKEVTGGSRVFTAARRHTFCLKLELASKVERMPLNLKTHEQVGKPVFLFFLSAVSQPIRLKMMT